MAKLADKTYLKRLLETPSVTGTESLVAHLVRERLAEYADVVETDVMGSVHARLLGNGSAPSVMIAAHMDEVGLMVKSIDSQGFLHVVPVGGVDAAILPGLRVDVHTAQGILRGVAGFSSTWGFRRVKCVRRFELEMSLHMALVLRSTVKGWPFPELSMTKRACT